MFSKINAIKTQAFHYLYPSIFTFVDCFDYWPYQRIISCPFPVHTTLVRLQTFLYIQPAADASLSAHRVRCNSGWITVLEFSSSRVSSFSFIPYLTQVLFIGVIVGRLLFSKINKTTYCFSICGYKLSTIFLRTRCLQMRHRLLKYALFQSFLRFCHRVLL